MLSKLALLIQHTLILSPAHPLLLHNASSDLWLSSPKFIEAQVLQGSQVILKTKAPGIVHAVGLERSANETTQRILLTSDANYAAFRHCPKVALSVEASPPRLMPPSSALANSSQDLSRELAKLRACGFDQISLDDSLLPVINASVQSAETRLASEGLLSGQGTWIDGRRHLVTGSSRQRVQSLLGPLSLVSDIEERELPKPGRTLIFKVTLFEVAQNLVRQLGIDWPQALGFRLSPSGSIRLKGSGGGSSNLQAGSDDIDFAALFSEAHSYGRVLAQPMIRTQPGEKASFQSGGELPIRNVSLHSSSTTWKSYGLILSLEPDAKVGTGAGEVSVNFKVELSEPDYANAIDGIPGMIVRKLESRFDLRTNETTILTTMVQSRQGTREDGVPGLLSLPFLGGLFSKYEKNNQGSELCFAIRPSWDEFLPRPQGFPKP
jgi:hypothetical protein